MSDEVATLPAEHLLQLNGRIDQQIRRSQLKAQVHDLAHSIEERYIRVTHQNHVDVAVLVSGAGGNRAEHIGNDETIRVPGENRLGRSQVHAASIARVAAAGSSRRRSPPEAAKAAIVQVTKKQGRGPRPAAPCPGNKWRALLTCMRRQAEWLTSPTSLAPSMINARRSASNSEAALRR